MTKDLSYEIEVTTDVFGERMILSHTGPCLKTCKRAAARWSKKNPGQIAYVVRYLGRESTGRISYASGLINTREGFFARKVGA